MVTDTIIDASAIFPNTTVENVTFTASSDIPAGAHILLEIPDWFVNNINVSPEFICRIQRSGASGGETYTGNIFLVNFGLHYEMERPGSRQLYVK